MPNSSAARSWVPDPGPHEWSAPARGWQQLNIALAQPDGYARLLTSHLPDRLTAWLAEGQAGDAYLMFKPPGVRLRVRAAATQPPLDALLRDAIEAGAARCGAVGVYDPEERLFGGPVGLDLAHAFFTADTAAVLAFHRAQLAGRTVLPPEAFTIAVVSRLFRRVFDAFEQWDVWHRVVGLRGGPPAVVSPGLADAADLGRTLADTAGLALAGLEESTATVFEASVDAVASGLLAAADAGRLSAGPRALLPFWVLFHWNRLGLDLDQQRQLAAHMAGGIAPFGR